MKMKFYSPIFFGLILLGIFVSCTKNEAAVEEITEVEEPQITETLATGMILSKKASLCLFGRDQKMHPFVNLYEGGEVSLLELDGVIDTKFVPDEVQADEANSAENGGFDELNHRNENQNLQNDESSKNSENQETVLKGTEYAHAVYDNVDFWIEKSVFALNCEKAVVIAPATLYAVYDLTQKLDDSPNPLKFAAIVGKSSDADSENPDSKSVKISFYDTNAKSVREAFVSKDSISTRIDDIEVSRIAEQLKTTKRAVPRNELFKEAAKYKPSQKVLAVLNAQKVEKKTYNYQEVLKSMQKMSFGVNVNELMTVDQSKDPFK